MQENVEPQQAFDDGRKHDRWLALKLAYERYAASSAVTEAISAEQTEPGPESELLRAFEVQQQRFQEYMEARIGYLEYHVDQVSAPEPAQTAQSRRTAVDWLAQGSRNRLARVLIATAACVTAFAVGVEMRLRVHKMDMAPPAPPMITMRDLPAIVPVNGTSGLTSVPLSTIHENEPLKRTPFPNPQPNPANPSRSIQKPRPRPVKAVAPHVTKVLAELSKMRGGPVSYDFALSLSHQSQRLGPLQVTLTAIDPQRKTVKLSIMAYTGKEESNRAFQSRATAQNRTAAEKRVTAQSRTTQNRFAQTHALAKPTEHEREKLRWFHFDGLDVNGMQ